MAINKVIETMFPKTQHYKRWWLHLNLLYPEIFAKKISLIDFVKNKKLHRPNKKNYIEIILSQFKLYPIFINTFPILRFFTRLHHLNVTHLLKIPLIGYVPK